MSFLNLQDKTFLLFGVSNRRSVAYAVASLLIEEGAKVILSVRTAERKAEVAKLMPACPAYVCDLEKEGAAQALADEIGSTYAPLSGILHSVAFANYSNGIQPFHKTDRKDFLQATTISAFSLVEVANAFKPYLAKTASVVTVGISSYVTAASYGYMSPIKQALEGCVRFLAKSFSDDTEVRFNSVNAGPLKTKSSAGIPGYLDNYLFGEKMTFRKRALETKEVANTCIFLLSERSSGINAQGIVVNAGMDINYFDQELVALAMGKKTPAKE